MAERFATMLAVEEGRAVLTVAAYRRTAERFLKGAAMTPDGLRAYLAQFPKPGTRRWHLIAVRRLCQWLVAEGELDSDPTKGLRTPAVKPGAVRALTESEDAALTSAVARESAEVILLVALMRRSGMRVGEIVGRGVQPPGIRLEHLDLDAGVIRVVGKGGGVAPVYLLRETVSRIRAQQETLTDRRPGAHLFQRPDGGPRSVKWAARVFGAAVRAAGIQRHVTPHQLRHTFASRFLENGGDIRAVQRLLRHKSLQSTMIYADYSDAALRRTFDQFGGGPPHARPSQQDRERSGVVRQALLENGIPPADFGD